MSFNPDNPRRKALIAMSGGVDSSVAAYLAIESGLDCIGVTMKLFNNEDAGISRELDAKNFNFIAFDTPPAEFRASARVRDTGRRNSPRPCASRAKTQCI